MMNYNLDSNGYIANYAVIGRVGNGIDYTGEIPGDFGEFYKAYKVVNGTLVRDDARAEELMNRESTPAVSLEEKVQELADALDALLKGYTE